MIDFDSSALNLPSPFGPTKFIKGARWCGVSRTKPPTPLPRSTPLNIRLTLVIFAPKELLFFYELNRHPQHHFLILKFGIDYVYILSIYILSICLHKQSICIYTCFMSISCIYTFCLYVYINRLYVYIQAFSIFIYTVYMMYIP